MIITLRKDVASAIPAHAADALVDLMSVLVEAMLCALGDNIRGAIALRMRLGDVVT
jgi:hypothetical protein